MIENKKKLTLKNKFMIDLLKEENEKVKYLIKSYTRTRLFKVYFNS